MVMADSPEEAIRSAEILPWFHGRSAKVRGSAWEIREIGNLELYGNQFTSQKELAFLFMFSKKAVI